MSIYELARGIPLPSSGDEWNRIRDGHIELPGFSSEFVSMIKVRVRCSIQECSRSVQYMIHPDMSQRPELLDVMSHPLVKSVDGHTTQLLADLQAADKTARSLRADVQRSNEEKRQLQNEVERLKAMLTDLALQSHMPVPAM